MRIIPVITLVLMFLVLPLSPARAQSTYDQLPPPAVLYDADDGRVEVLAFFWYGCGSCYYIDDAIQKWAAQLPKDVRFKLLPAAFNPPVDFHAQIFLTLRALGLSHQADAAVFDRFQKDRKPVSRRDQLPELIKLLKVDEKEFMAAFDSPAVKAELAKLGKFMDTYDLPGVPSMVIDGKYRFDLGQTQGADGYFDQAEALIKLETEARKKSGR